MFGPGLFFQTLSTFVDATSVLNICKSTPKILYNKSTKRLQILRVEGSAFSVPPSPTVTLVLGRRQGSAEQQTRKRSCSATRIGFSTREKVRMCRAQRSGTLLSPQNPSLGLGGGEMSREPSVLKIEIVGSKEALSRNAWEGGRLVGRGREVLQKGGIWGGYSRTRTYGRLVIGETPAVTLGGNCL